MTYPYPSWTKKLFTFQERTIYFGKIFCFTLLMGIIGSTTIAVSCRYLFFFPLNFSDQLSIYLLTWLTFMGAGIAFYHHEHVMVSFFIIRFHKSIQRRLLIVSALLIIIFWTIIVYTGFQVAWEFRGSKDPLLLNMSLIYPYLSVPIGGAYLILQVIITSIRQWYDLR